MVSLKFAFLAFLCSVCLNHVKSQSERFSRAGSYLAFDPPNPCADDTYDCYFRFLSGLPNIRDRNISALFQSFPHFSLADPSGVFLTQSSFTIEVFVRIRDRRLLSGTGQRPPRDRYIPLIGNLQLVDNFGYELSCQRRGSAIFCCMRVFHGSAALPPAEACVDVSSIAGDWFYLAGTYNADATNGMAKVRAFSPYTRLRASDLSNSVQNIAAFRQPSFGSLVLRIGMQIPVLNNGLILQGPAEFFTGDLDEIRIWKGVVGFDDGLELETVRPDEYSRLLLYIPVRHRSPVGPGTAFNGADSVFQNLSNGVRGPAQFNAKPLPTATVAAALDTREVGLAWNLTVAAAPTADCNLALTAFVQPAWQRPCFSTYLDQRADAALASAVTSAAITLDDPPAPPAAAQWRVGLDQRQPGAAARVVVRKANWRDTLFAPAGGAVVLTTSLNLALDTGLPFHRNTLVPPATGQFLFALPAAAASLAADAALADERGCVGCAGGAPCNCLLLTLSLAGVGALCDARQCPPALQHNSSLRHLCFDWWVPAARGWTFSADVEDSSPLYAGVPGGRLRAALRGLLGYEASPEWFGAGEAPALSAFACDAVSYAQSAGEPDGRLYVVVPGTDDLAVYLRARDRNLGDAVDILPLDDPGLPNGARLCPAAFYDAADPHSTCHPLTLQPAPAAYQTTDCAPAVDPRFAALPTYRGPLAFAPACLRHGDRLFAVPQAREARPRLWQRTLLFSPAADQAGRAYALKFVAASYPSPACAGEDWAPGAACGETISGAFPPAGGYPNDSEQARTVRTVNILVPSTRVAFEDPTPPDGSEQLFVAGCAAQDSDLRLFVRAAPDVSAAAGIPHAGAPIYIGRYTFSVGPDLEHPPPPGVALAEARRDEESDGSARLEYRVSWAPGLGVPAMGARGCFRAGDHAGVAWARRCFVFRRDKCRYCAAPGETLAGVGRRFGVDWLQIYLANPLLRTPDALPPYTVLTVGVTYRVRPGDTLDAIARRFAEPAPAIRALNSDVAWGDDPAAPRALPAGTPLCIIPRVCDSQ